MSSATPLITDPFAITTFLMAFVGAVLLLGRTRLFAKIYAALPAVVFIYFLPLGLTAVGIIPEASPVYEWARAYLLPAALFLLTIGIDVGAILRVGRPAAIAMLAGAIGVVIGCVVAFVLFEALLPEEGWQALSILSATWIGGSANMISMQQGLQAPDSIMGPIVIVDTVVGYGWVAVMIATSVHQTRIDKWLGADSARYHTPAVQTSDDKAVPTPANITDLAVLLGLGGISALTARTIGEALPQIGDPVIISASTWAMLISVTFGLAASFTRARQFADRGANALGYVGLYFLLATVGAKAGLRGVTEAPVFMMAGLVILATHLLVLIVLARWLRLPMFLIATASVANIGGPVTAPIVASAYRTDLATLGLLLGISGYILGIYMPIGVAAILSTLHAM